MPPSEFCRACLRVHTRRYRFPKSARKMANRRGRTNTRRYASPPAFSHAPVALRRDFSARMKTHDATSATWEGRRHVDDTCAARRTLCGLSTAGDIRVRATRTRAESNKRVPVPAASRTTARDRNRATQRPQQDSLEVRPQITSQCTRAGGMYTIATWARACSKRRRPLQPT